MDNQRYEVRAIVAEYANGNESYMVWDTVQDKYAYWCSSVREAADQCVKFNTYTPEDWQRYWAKFADK